jgi:hypothetical protein
VNIRIDRGDPTPEEIAAIVGVLAGRWCPHRSHRARFRLVAADCPAGGAIGANPTSRLSSLR